MTKIVQNGGVRSICEILHIDKWKVCCMELSDNDKAAIMQIKEPKDVLNGQCEIIGFTLEGGGVPGVHNADNTV